MAYFARINQDNVVDFVGRIPNERCLNGDGVEDEAIGKEFCISLWGDGNWLQTSYNGTIRANYAGIDYVYDPDLDVFIPPKPYPSWVFDDINIWWMPPTPYPNDGKAYNWDEKIIGWKEAKEPSQ